MPWSVPDFVYDAAAAFYEFMGKGSLVDTLLILVLGILGAFLVTVLHEVGHAAAAVATGRRVDELRVGDVDDIDIRWRGFRLRLGRLLGSSDAAGTVRMSGGEVTALRMLVVALAGPAANVLGALVAAPLAVRAEGVLSLMIWLWAAMNLVAAVENLRRTGALDAQGEWTDGRIAWVAWSVLRHRPPTTCACGVAHPATSNAPPGGTTGRPSEAESLPPPRPDEALKAPNGSDAAPPRETYPPGHGLQSGRAI